MKSLYERCKRWLLLSTLIILLLTLVVPHQVAHSALLSLADLDLSLTKHTSGWSYMSPSPLALDKSMSLTANLDVLYWGYLNNDVFGSTANNLITGDGQFRTVGWHWQLGIHLTDSIDVYYNHISQHTLDTPEPYGNYPFENSVGIKVKLYHSPKEKESVF